VKEISAMASKTGNQQTIQRSPHNKENPYVSILRTTAQDKRLSYEARGLLAYLLSKPHDWQVKLHELQHEKYAGRDKVQRILKELAAFGYLTRPQKYQDKTGKWCWTPYYVWEEPQHEPSTEKPLTANQSLVNRLTDEPSTANPSSYIEQIYKSQNHKEQIHTTDHKASSGGDATAAPASLLPDSHPPVQVAELELPASKQQNKEEKSSAKKEESPAASVDDGLAQVVKAYEENIGLVTSLIADTLKSAVDDYGAGWTVEAIGIAVKAEKRFWRYVEGILKKWKRDGKDTPAPVSGGAPAKSPAKQQQYVTVPKGSNPFSAATTEKGLTHD
jgi:DnaD/phage-associated family protein